MSYKPKPPLWIKTLVQIRDIPAGEYGVVEGVHESPDGTLTYETRFLPRSHDQDLVMLTSDANDFVISEMLPIEELYKHLCYALKLDYAAGYVIDVEDIDYPPLLRLHSISPSNMEIDQTGKQEWDSGTTSYAIFCVHEGREIARLDLGTIGMWAEDRGCEDLIVAIYHHTFGKGSEDVVVN